MIIGLCGGSGSGKGVVCALFDKLGIPSIDTDQVYHISKMLSEGGLVITKLSEEGQSLEDYYLGKAGDGHE